MVDEALPPVVEEASSGRAACRGCKQKIAKGTWRVGERTENPFTDNAETSTPALVYWFHPHCAAYRRPQVMAAALTLPELPWPQTLQDELAGLCQQAQQHPRLVRLHGVEHASSGRARCRQCQEPIAKGTLRLQLSYFEAGRWDAGGFVHPDCASTYFGTAELLSRVRWLCPELPTAELDALAAAFANAPAN